MTSGDRRHMDRRGRLMPVARTSSPQLCAACFRPHTRLASKERRQALFALHDELVERSKASPDTEWREYATSEYAYSLFDHVTLGTKVSDPDAPQAHPPPPVPGRWTADHLAEVERLVLRHTIHR